LKIAQLDLDIVRRLDKAGTRAASWTVELGLGNIIGRSVGSGRIASGSGGGSGALSGLLAVGSRDAAREIRHLV